MPTKYKRVLVKLSGEALSDREHDAILGAYNLNKVSQAPISFVRSNTAIFVTVFGITLTKCFAEKGR